MSQPAPTAANGTTEKRQEKGSGEKTFKKEYNKEKRPYNRDNKETNGAEEEHKGEKQGYKYRSKNKGGFKERIEVTLDTVVPDLPKKNEIHPKPDDEAFQNELEKIQKDIDDTYKKMTDIAREARNKSYLPQDKTFEDLISLLKVKQEERKKAYDEFQAIMTERDMYKKQVDEYYEKGNEYRFKMKIPGKKTDLEAQLRDLKNTQSKGSITLQEEKRLIKEIADLEKSLPYAGPLEELEEQAKEIKELLKTAKAKTAGKFKGLETLREECKDIQDKIDKMREEHEKKKEESTPAIDKMKEEYRSKINALKQKRKDMYDQQNEAWRKFEDQQAEIERIKLIKRKKEKLVRDEQRRLRDEERRKQREMEEADNKEIPYRTQIELCELLIKYCNKLAPATEDNNTTVTQKDKNVAIQEALQSDEWKNAKGQYVASRREKEDDFFTGTGKKKDKKKAQPKTQEEKPAQPTNLPLNHQIETLNYFDEIRVAPPLFTDKLTETLKVLQEKKAYFEKLSTEAIQADEARQGMNEEDRKKYDEEQKQKKQEEQQQTKKEERRTTKQKKFDVESEQDFPKM